MFIPDPIYAKNNLASSFYGVFNANGVTGANFNVASNFANAAASVLGLSAPSDAGGGAGGYSGGGINPGSGSAGASSQAPGGMFGTAQGTAYVGGQNPKCKTTELPPPTDAHDSLNTDIFHAIISAASAVSSDNPGGCMSTLCLNNCSDKPTPNPDQKLGCVPCAVLNLLDLWRGR